MNITLNIDEEIVKKIRKVAIDKDTTLTATVRDYLTWVAKCDALERRQSNAARPAYTGFTASITGTP